MTPLWSCGISVSSRTVCASLKAIPTGWRTLSMLLHSASWSHQALMVPCTPGTSTSECRLEQCESPFISRFRWWRKKEKRKKEEAESCTPFMKSLLSYWVHQFLPGAESDFWPTMLSREQRGYHNYIGSCWGPLLCWLPRSDTHFATWVAHQWPPAHNGEKIPAQYQGKKTTVPVVDTFSMFVWHD